jgi:hypothetical protein
VFEMIVEHRPKMSKMAVAAIAASSNAVTCMLIEDAAAAPAAAAATFTGCPCMDFEHKLNVLKPLMLTFTRLTSPAATMEPAVCLVCATVGSSTPPVLFASS